MLKLLGKQNVTGKLQSRRNLNDTGTLFARYGVDLASRDACGRADYITTEIPQLPSRHRTEPNRKGHRQIRAGAGGLVDINSASVEELDKLPGVGPARAQAIISHRPYHGKDDLTNRKIISESVYNEIKDKIIARQGPTK